MKPRQLSQLLQLPVTQRFPVMAEGLGYLAENVATLSTDAADLAERGRWRAAAILAGNAEEEAAKALMLLDVARAGWSDQATVAKVLRGWFYDHLARGLYVRAYDGRPASLGEVRSYVDSLRRDLYLDGPNDVDWVFRNEILSGREDQAYVDFVQSEDGTCAWSSPAG